MAIDPRLDEETKRIIYERLKTIDENIKTARPGKEVLAELRAKFKKKPAAPR